jgi:hypothetical protein
MYGITITRAKRHGATSTGRPEGGIHIGKKLIVVEGAELSAQRNVGVSFGERGLHRGHGRLWDGR